MSPVTELTNKLSAIRLRIRLLFLLDGIARLVILIIIFSAVTFFIDWTIPDLPAPVRLSFMAIGAVVAASFLYRYLIYPVKATIPDDALVTHLERKYPALRERLLSTLQLGRTTDKFNSPELVDRLVTETLSSSREVDFNAVINPARPRKLALVSLLFFGLAALYAISYPLYTGIWLNRAFGGSARWPKRVMIEVEVKNAPNNIAARNQDISVIAKVLKGSISKAYIYYQPSTPAPDASYGEPPRTGVGTPLRLREGESTSTENPGLSLRQERMTAVEGNVFKFDFLQARESFRFYVRGGDDQTSWINIAVLTPPALEKIACYYEYPAYITLSLGLNPGTTQYQEGGSIKAPLGTKVTLKGICNLELKEAILEVSSQDNTDTKKQTTPMEILNNAQSRPQEIQGALTVLADANYTIRLTALNGLVNTDPIRYPIKVIRDTPPLLKIIEPGSEYKYVTPLATLPVELLTTDDYGINNVDISYITQTESPAGPSGSSTPAAEPAARKIELYNALTPVTTTRVETHYLFRLTPLNLKDGDIVRYFFQAVDNCEIPQPNQTRSNEYRLIVISQAQMAKRVDEIMLRLKEDIRRTKELQEKNLQETAEISKQPAEDTASEASSQKLNYQLSAQRRIGQEVERLSKEFKAALNDVNANQLWDESMRKKLDSLSQTLKDIAQEKSPAATSALSQARDAQNQQHKQQSLSNAQANQKDIADDLKQVLAQMEQWEDYQEIVRQTKDILQRQKKILEDAKTTTADTPSEKEGLKDREKTVQKDTEGLEMKMERVSDKLKEMQPYYAQKLNEALAMLRRELVKDNIRETIQSLEQGRGGNAIAKAEQVTAALTNLLEFLEDKINQDELKNKIAQLTKMMQSVQDLKNAQSEIAKETGKLSQSAAQSPEQPLTPEDQRKLERLAKRQKETEKETNKLAEEAERDNEKKAGQGMKNAGAKMSSAEQGMSQGKPDDAKPDAEEALKELQRVYELLREKLEQLQQEKQQKELAKLEDTLSQISEKQEELNRQTINFHSKRTDDLSREDILTVKKLGNDQDSLAKDTESVEQSLAKDGSAVFGPVAARIKDDMKTAGKLLADEHRTDRYTTTIQKDIIDNLAKLIDALHMERMRRKALQDGMGGGGGGSMDQPLVPIIAELKMLKTLQQDLKTRTDRFKNDNLKADTGGFDPVQQAILRRLSAQEGALAEMSADLADKIQKITKDRKPKDADKE